MPSWSDIRWWAVCCITYAIGLVLGAGQNWWVAAGYGAFMVIWLAVGVGLVVGHDAKEPPE